MERIHFQMSYRLIAIGVAFDLVLTSLLLFGATREGADPSGIPAIVGLGVVLLVFPAMLFAVQLRNRAKVIVIGPEGIEIPSRLRSEVFRIAFADLQNVEERVISQSGARVGRALWVTFPGGKVEVLESDIGPLGFERVRAALSARR